MPTGTEQEPIWRRPHKGRYPDIGLFAYSGLEQLRQGRMRRYAIPPISYLTEMMFDEVSRGHATFSIPASPWFANATGLIGGGVLAMLADAPLGASIHTDLPPATPYATAELSITFLSPVRPDPERRVVGSGQLIHRGRSVALSEAFLIAEPAGEMVAHATSRCAVFPSLDPPPERPDGFPEGEDPLPGESADDPLRLPLRGAFLSSEEFESRSGLELARAWVTRELEPPPIHYLTGVDLVHVDDGVAVMKLPCSPWLSTAMRTVQGGFTAMLAEAALASAAFTTAPAGTATAPLDLKVNLLRPVQPDGRNLTARAEVTHRGRTLAVSTARVENADRKPVAIATGSAMYLPGRSMDLSGVELGAGDSARD